jgi:hypothetical protein
MKEMQLQDVCVGLDDPADHYLDVDVIYHLDFEVGERYPIVHVDDVKGLVVEQYVSVRHEVVDMPGLEQRLADEVIENMWADGELS